MRDERIPWVDNAKGICVILVVMMHSALGVGEAMEGEGALHLVVAFAKPFRMPDFFVVAGLFLSRSIDRDWRLFLDRKVAHFAYFYLLWLLLQWMFKSGVWTGGDPLAALRQLALALVEPFGTLWFIYLLPLFFVTTKLLRWVPPLVMLFAAGSMETARVETGWTIPDEFAARYLYFLAGYHFAPRFFAAAEWARRNSRRASLGLAAWAAANAILAFSPAPFGDYPTLASLPLVSLAAGLAGATAVVVAAALLCDLRGTGWLRYCGANSLAIYLGFFLPMAVARMAIVEHGLIDSVGAASSAVTLIGVAGPLLLHRLTKDGPFRFLFERPHLLRLRMSADGAESRPARQELSERDAL